MREWQSQSQVRWYGRYHVVLVPKYRRRSIDGSLRVDIGRVMRELCRQHEVELVGGHAMADHMHLCLSIPPKYSVANTVGFLKGKSAIRTHLWVDNASTQDFTFGPEDVIVRYTPNNSHLRKRASKDSFGSGTALSDLRDLGRSGHSRSRIMTPEIVLKNSVLEAGSIYAADRLSCRHWKRFRRGQAFGGFGAIVRISKSESYGSFPRSTDFESPRKLSISPSHPDGPGSKTIKAKKPPLSREDVKEETVPNRTTQYVSNSGS